MGSRETITRKDEVGGAPNEKGPTVERVKYGRQWVRPRRHS